MFSTVLVVSCRSCAVGAHVNINKGYKHTDNSWLLRVASSDYLFNLKAKSIHLHKGKVVYVKGVLDRMYWIQLPSPIQPCVVKKLNSR